MTTKRGRGRRPPPLFPRSIKPMPRFEAPGAATARLRAERLARARDKLIEAERRRYRLIRRAFVEGAAYGREWLDPVESWRASQTYQLVYPKIDGPKGLQHEWKLRAGSFYDQAYAERWWRRCDELAWAFELGHYAGSVGYDLAEAWQHSPIRRSLYQGPQTPLHLRIRMMAHGGGFDPERAP